MVDRLGAGADRAAARDQQHADGFAVAAGAGLGEVLARERFAGGADGVKLVGLGAVAARRTLGPVDFDDPLEMPCASKKLASPAPKLPEDSIAQTRVAAREAQQPLVAEGVGRDRGLGRNDARCGRDGGGRVRVAVRVDADDVVRAALRACPSETSCQRLTVLVVGLGSRAARL